MMEKAPLDTYTDKGELAVKVIAMPADANADGDMFGGWILSQMDLAGAVPARRRARKRIVTVAVEHIVFHKPVFVGDCLECYATIEKIGRTSITVKVETFVERRDQLENEKITEGRFVYVAIGNDRRPVSVA
ncbi:MAG: acyl-CoA thioesterase [Alphaproteobacteria bacterium]